MISQPSRSKARKQLASEERLNIILLFTYSTFIAVSNKNSESRMREIIIKIRSGQKRINEKQKMCDNKHTNMNSKTIKSSSVCLQ